MKRFVSLALIALTLSLAISQAAEARTYVRGHFRGK
jgi:hypothetical protein